MNRRGIQAYFHCPVNGQVRAGEVVEWTLHPGAEIGENSQCCAKRAFLSGMGFAAPHKSGSFTFPKLRRRLQNCDWRRWSLLAEPLLKEEWVTVEYLQANRSGRC